MTDLLKSSYTLPLVNHNERKFLYNHLDKTIYYFSFSGNIVYKGRYLENCWLSAQNCLDPSNLPDKNILDRIECKLYDYKFTGANNKNIYCN